VSLEASRLLSLVVEFLQMRHDERGNWGHGAGRTPCLGWALISERPSWAPLSKRLQLCLGVWSWQWSRPLESLCAAVHGRSDPVDMIKVCGG